MIPSISDLGPFANDLLDDLLRAECRASLHYFVQTFWPAIEPGRPFIDGWHLHWLCNELEAVSRGETTRLLVNVPPGAMKSLLVNCFLPAWEWGPRGMPSMRYILASYSQDLGIRDNRRLRAIVTDPLHQRLWPEVRIDPRRDAAENLGNTSTGWSVATSTGGVGTGLRADRFLVDDPHSVRMAESDAVRESTVRWWREVVPTRLSDPAESAIVVIMQRVHEGDVSGDIIDSTPEARTRRILM